MDQDRNTTLPTSAPKRRVVAIVPARNEPDIADTIRSLYAQTHPVTLVCVVTNNCTLGDTTAEQARAAGAYVIDMPANRHLKAGALNRALDGLDVYLTDDDAILLMDADSILSPDWVANALPELDEHGALSGAFEANSMRGFLPLLQRAEYAQARHRTQQMAGRVNVLSGAAAMFQMGLLRQVRTARGGLLPGIPGDWYDTSSMTEDFELTMAVRRLGCQPMSPPGLRVRTDVMRTVGQLWRQRIRWQQGNLQAVVRYPLTVTWRVWATQTGVYLSMLAPLLLAMLVAGELAAGTWTFDPRWLALPVLFAVAEMWSARRAGPAAVLLCAALLPMMLYRGWKTAVYLTAVPRAIRAAGLSWGLERG